MDGVFTPDALATVLADAPASHFSAQFVNIYIPVAALAGLLFALYQVAMVSGIRVHSLLLDEDTEALLGPASDHDGARTVANRGSQALLTLTLLQISPRAQLTSTTQSRRARSRF